MLRYAAPAVATLALLLAAPPAMALDQVRFYAPFEDTVDPQFAAGRAGPIARGQEAFTSGRRGRALSVTSASAPLEYLATGNLQGSSGTLAFWVRLDWTPSSSDPDREYRHLFNMNRFGFMAYLHMGRLVVASGTSDAAGKWTWHYGPSERVDGWRAGEWHHVAITWSSDDRACDKAVYVDGSLSAQRTGGPVHRMVSEASFRVAPVTDGLLASGAYDDLVITGRPLSAAEVAALARGDHDAALDALKIVPPEPPALAVERATEVKPRAE